MIHPTAIERRVGAALLAVCGVLALAGCGDKDGGGSASESSGSSESGKPAEEELTAAEKAQAEVDALDWQRVDADIEGYSFEIPDDWSIGEGDSQGAGMTIEGADGTERAVFNGDLGGVGGTCAGLPTYKFQQVDETSAKVPGLGKMQVDFILVEGAEGLGGMVSLEDGAIDLSDTCVVYSMMTLPKNPGNESSIGQGYFATAQALGGEPPEDEAMRFDSIEDAEAYTETADYLTLVHMFSSLEYAK